MEKCLHSRQECIGERVITYTPDDVPRLGIFSRWDETFEKEGKGRALPIVDIDGKGERLCFCLIFPYDKKFFECLTSMDADNRTNAHRWASNLKLLQVLNR